ncbi:MAG TPA: hypothetical protein V8P47_01525 [Candidatus Azosocius sp. HAIN]
MIIIKAVIVIFLIILFLIMGLYIFLKNKEYYNMCSNLPFNDEDLFKEK